METEQVPQDPSFRAYRLARKHGQDSDLSKEQIRDIIMAEGIDEPTAMEAVESVFQDREDRWKQFDKQLGFTILISIAASLIAAFNRNAEFFLMIPLAGAFLLITYPWGWKRPKD